MRRNRVTVVLLIEERAGTHRRVPALARVLLLRLGALREPPRVAEVRVPFEERDVRCFVGVRADVAEHVETVAGVGGVDPAVADDGKAPPDRTRSSCGAFPSSATA